MPAFINTYGFTQLVTEPTRLNNTLDLFLTNNPEKINCTKVLPGISDHQIPYTEISLRANRRRQAARTVFVYKRADWHGLNEHIRPLLAPLATSTDSVENIWQEFKSTLTQAAEKYIPQKDVKSRPSQPWISKHLQDRIKLRDRLHQKSKKHGRLRVEERFLNLKKEVQRELRREHDAHVEGILTDEGAKTTETSKKFWKYVKHKRADSSGIGTLRVGDKLLTNPAEKAEALNNHFKSVFTPATNENDAWSPTNRNLMSHVTVGAQGVLAQLKKLNPHKATGPDNLSARLLKETAESITPTLKNIFQLSLDRAETPTDWRHARVCAIYKKGDRYDPSNYRPISITCLCSKFLEHIVTSQMMSYLENNNILHGRQHGFRSQRSCESQLIELTTQISESLDQGEEIDAIVLDFSKAFDKVCHDKLVRKVDAVGVNPQVTRWLTCFLANRTQEVVVDGHRSLPCEVSSGVPQGSVVGPALFLVYINDLPASVQSEVRLFADDTVLHTTTDNARKLQDDLDALEKWEAAWGMQFNPSKCQHIKFSRKRVHTIDNTFSLHNTPIPKKTDIKYLGVKLESSLRWNLNTEYVAGKASGKVGFIRRTIPPSLKHLRDKAYKTLARPVLEYASTVWDSYLTSTQTKQLEDVQRRGARMVNNIPRTDHVTSTTALINNLEWETLSERRAKRRLGIFRAMHFGEVATNVTDFLQPQTSTVGYSRRHHQQYAIPHTGTKYHIKSFFISTAKSWNSLPANSALLVGPPTPVAG